MPAASTAAAMKKDASLPEPHSTLVYSSYDDDKPENFFGHLQIWLEGTPRLETVRTQPSPGPERPTSPQGSGG